MVQYLLDTDVCIELIKHNEREPYKTNLPMK